MVSLKDHLEGSTRNNNNHENNGVANVGGGGGGGSRKGMHSRSNSLTSNPDDASSVGSEQRKSSISVAKILTKLLQMSSNRSCADCRSALVDPSQIMASFCPRQEYHDANHPYQHSTPNGTKTSTAITKSPTNNNTNNNGGGIGLPPRAPSTPPRGAIRDFKNQHDRFAPPGCTTPRRNGRRNSSISSDPAVMVNQRYGGHGVFICAACAAAHKLLGDSITIVQPVQDYSVWNIAKATIMKESGCNARSWVVYEAYMPQAWQRRRPNPTSTLSERLFFCRAKYEALAFVMPPPGPRTKAAWTSILKRSKQLQPFANPDLTNLHSLAASSATNKSTEIVDKKDDGLPLRLIDYFCIVKSSMQLHPSEVQRDLSVVENPEEINFWPHVSDCYPTRSAHADTEFPEQVSNFVLPEGCQPSRMQLPPTFFTFVLTTAEGYRLYGATLQIYDETTDGDTLFGAIQASGYRGDPPEFLVPPSDTHGSDVFFFPKCLVLLSHYPFFDMFRKVLLQLYRITLVEAPLPIERYIQNVVAEVPLPPRGKIKVEFGLTTDHIMTLKRPPMNQLPMIDFSLRPLFASLSPGNILVILACLLEERKVVLLSKHYCLLTPVAEAFISFLFPFEWQGIYIPVMPYSMLEILDAPIPFFIGLHSRYLTQVEPNRRPRGVIFVDLDRDVIHLGFDEDTGKRKMTPMLPNKDSQKLKSRLEEFGSCVYLIPDSGIKGCIMTGSNLLLMNDERGPYAHMVNVAVTAETFGRKKVFRETDKAYSDNELLIPITGFQYKEGHLSKEPVIERMELASFVERRKSSIKTMFRRKRSTVDSVNSESARAQGHLLDLTEPEEFSSVGIRSAFLWFLVTLFRGYEDCLVAKGGRAMFDEQKFLNDLNVSQESIPFFENILRTQMFQRFLEIRMEDPERPEVRFFDESIIAKGNRSKKNALTSGGKKATPFLDDESGKITKTFTPPTPSNMGLPDDGRSYRYGTFPSLNAELFGRKRAPMVWTETRNSSMRMVRGSLSTRAQAKQQEILKKAMKPVVSAPAAIYAVARRSAKDLESALSALSPNIGTGSKLSGKRGKYYTALQDDDNNNGSEVQDLQLPGSTLTRAEMLILNARRKQGILLNLVIKLEAFMRMAVRRSKYMKFRRAIITLQRQFRHSPLIKVEVDTFDLKRRKAIVIQRIYRAYCARSQAKYQLESFVVIQKWYRGVVVRQRIRAMHRAATKIQAVIRGRRTRFARTLLELWMNKVKAYCRGVIIRKRTRKVLKDRLVLYASQMFHLWQLAHTPLSYRSKFWPLVTDGMGFLRLRVAESELQRLWKELVGNMPVYNVEKTVCKDELYLIANRLGIDNKVYWIALEINNKLMSSSTTTSTSSKPTTGASSKFLPAAENAVAFEDGERLQVYERLNLNPGNIDLMPLYKKFGIDAAAKTKKFLLSKAIWTKKENAALSVSTMVQLFPELKGYDKVVFVSPSSKGLRRFKSNRNITAPPMEQKLWENTSLERIIQKHMMEVASVMLSSIPLLITKLDEAERDKLEQFRRRREAAMMSMGIMRWNLCQSQIMARYLDPATAAEQGNNDEVASVGSSTTTQVRRNNSMITTEDRDNNENYFDDDDDQTAEEFEVSVSATNPFADSENSVDVIYNKTADQKETIIMTNTETNSNTNPFGKDEKEQRPESAKKNPFEEDTTSSPYDNNNNPFDDDDYNYNNHVDTKPGTNPTNPFVEDSDRNDESETNPFAANEDDPEANELFPDFSPPPETNPFNSPASSKPPETNPFDESDDENNEKAEEKLDDNSNTPPPQETSPERPNRISTVRKTLFAPSPSTSDSSSDQPSDEDESNEKGGNGNQNETVTDNGNNNENHVDDDNNGDNDDDDNNGDNDDNDNDDNDVNDSDDNDGFKDISTSSDEINNDERSTGSHGSWPENEIRDGRLFEI